MNILGLLKKKYRKEIDQKPEEGRERHQLNMTIDVRLIGNVKQLAAEFEIPRYIILEHSLETGYKKGPLVRPSTKSCQHLFNYGANGSFTKKFGRCVATLSNG